MAATYEPIASTTLGSAATSVTFGSGGTLPQTYTDLIVVINATATPTTAYTGVRFNADSGSNYSTTVLRGNGSSASSARYSSQSEGYTSQANALSTTVSTVVIHVMSYSNTNVYTTYLAADSASSVEVNRAVGLWRSTSAITSIELRGVGGNGFGSGSTFSLYGIKAA
jgi:hypothetical protein